MLFNSWQYGVFLPIVFALYWVLPHKYRWPLLLAASYYFYMSWNVKYVVLILFTTAVSYTAALLLEKTEQRKKRHLLLTAVLVACLGVLFVFKYWNFFFGSLAALMQRFAIPLHPMTLRLLLPVGISFYTFQTLGYVIDVYRGDVEAEKNFGVYATFISFFPQLVAGPIERTKNLLPQIKAEHTFDYDQATYGLKLMAWGYFKKMAIADVISIYVDRTYADLWACTGFDLVIAIFFFSLQIYCDFSGYSDIAIGTAKLLGINLVDNFKSPYMSLSVKEFWSRWHISLSTWFRDYVYIPLGGNHVSKLRNYTNLLVTFLLSGLWHGANWTYVIWGGVHGFARIVEKIFNFDKKREDKKIFKIFKWALVFAFCNIAWVFFRADSFADALTVFYRVVVSFADINSFVHTKIGLSIKNLLMILLLVGVLVIYDYLSLKNDVIRMISKKPLGIRWAVYLLFVVGTSFVYLLMGIENVAFIYFQF